MSVKQSHPKRWYEHRLISLFLGLVSLGCSYGVASRAWNTGSWWEYLGALILLLIALKWLKQTFRPSKQDESPDKAK
ncbi:MAG TPA: hypothetical protein VMR18_04595 [Candidatus Saccharimonadales bacterium]|nr:hypothetical protein [Candidatus Saccharimonadales bacterium]